MSEEFNIQFKNTSNDEDSVFSGVFKAVVQSPDETRDVDTATEFVKDNGDGTVIRIKKELQRAPTYYNYNSASTNLSGGGAMDGDTGVIIKTAKDFDHLGNVFANDGFNLNVSSSDMPDDLSDPNHKRVWVARREQKVPPPFLTGLTEGSTPSELGDNPTSTYSKYKAFKNPTEIAALLDSQNAEYNALYGDQTSTDLTNLDDWDLILHAAMPLSDPRAFYGPMAPVAKVSDGMGGLMSIDFNSSMTLDTNFDDGATAYFKSFDQLGKNGITGDLTQTWCDPDRQGYFWELQGMNRDDWEEWNSAFPNGLLGSGWEVTQAMIGNEDVRMDEAYIHRYLNVPDAIRRFNISKIIDGEQSDNYVSFSYYAASSRMDKESIGDGGVADYQNNEGVPGWYFQRNFGTGAKYIYADYPIETEQLRFAWEKNDCIDNNGNYKNSYRTETVNIQGLPQLHETPWNAKSSDYRYPFWLNGRDTDGNSANGANLSIFNNVPKLYHSNGLFSDWASMCSRIRYSDASFGSYGGIRIMAHERLRLALVISHNFIRQQRNGYAVQVPTGGGAGLGVDSGTAPRMTVTPTTPPEITTVPGAPSSLSATVVDDDDDDDDTTTTAPGSPTIDESNISIISDPPSAPTEFSTTEIIPDATEAPGAPRTLTLTPDEDIAKIIPDPPGAISTLIGAPQAEPSGAVGDLEAIVTGADDLICTTVGVTVSPKRPPWLGVTRPSKYKGFVFDERIQGLSGPFVNGAITAITNKDNSAELVAVNESFEASKSDLLDFNDPDFSEPPSFESVYPDIDVPIEYIGTDFDIVMSAIGEGFSYRGVYKPTPFDETFIGAGQVEDPKFFRDSYLAVIETNWLHLGDEHNQKQLHRIDLSFHKHSFGALFAYVKNDEGMVKGQYKGGLAEHMKVFTNIRGRRFKIMLMIPTHKKYPWALREMSIGHLYGKSF
tara:strand:+ start:9243 stop:12074 length:2832 start_codon:yes stop_codon:yes gene_type:complete